MSRVTVTGDVTSVQPGGNTVSDRPPACYDTVSETIRIFRRSAKARGCDSNGASAITLEGQD